MKKLFSLFFIVLLIIGCNPLDSALKRALRSGYLDEAMIAVYAGADVNVATIDGTTVLMLAARHDSANLAQDIISAGADVNATNNGGNTALDRADSEEMINLLTEYGAKLGEGLTQGEDLTPSASQTASTFELQAILANLSDNALIAIQTPAGTAASVNLSAAIIANENPTVSLTTVEPGTLLV
ncbi:MAG: ankyrin repeat domain-containing protein, partial [Salinispira sp.]